MNDNNYIMIQGWMINQLKLKSNELILFAIVYGFSQDGKSTFRGSLSYISKALNCSKNTTISTTNKLLDKVLIIKNSVQENTSNGNSFYNVFTINYDVINETLEGSAKTEQGSAKIGIGVVQKLGQGSAKTEHNNNTINIIDNKDWLYSNFELKYFDWRNIRPIEKQLQKEFINIWSEEKEIVKQKTYLKQLPEAQTELYLQIRSIHTKTEVRNALKALLQQKEIFLDSQITDPKYFLNNFNKWMAAFVDGNKEVYVKKEKSNKL